MPGADSDRRAAAAAWLVPAALLAAAWPVGEYCVNDDWQTYWSAIRFARTGDVRIVDYSAMGLVGWSVPLGIVARFLGESFTGLRLVSMATLPLTGWMALRCGSELGLRRAHALLLSLATTLWPVAFWLSTSAMTDAPFHALWVLGVWMACRALRNGDRTASWLAAAAAVWAAWIRVPVAALPLALAAAAALLPPGAPARRRAWTAAAAALLLGTAGFAAWYSGVHGETAAWRAKSAWDTGEALAAVPGGVFAAVCYGGLALAPLAPLALSGATRRTRGPGLTAALAVGCALAAVALVQAKTGFLPSVRKSMPYLPNVAWNLGLGPMTLTDVYREGGPPPVALPGWAQVAAGVLAAGLGGALVARLVARVARARRDPVVVFLAVAVVLYAGAAILFTREHAPLFDRYLVPLTFPAGLLLLAPAPAAEEPSAGGLRPGWLLLAASAAFAVIGTADHHRFARARADLCRAGVEAAAGDTTVVDGGFEFNCWNNYVAAARREFEVHPTWKGWFVADPGWVVATRPREGYDVADRRRVAWFLGAASWDLLLLRRRGG